MQQRPDIKAEYDAYLLRFHKEAGEHAVGEFVKNQGRLVKKLPFDEFSTMFIEYFQSTNQFIDSMNRGMTANEALIRMIRDRASMLFLHSPC